MSRLGGMRPRSRYRFGAQEAPDHGMYANTVIRLILHLCSESCAPFPVLWLESLRVFSSCASSGTSRRN